jgi:hypothetical protein
MFYKKLKNFVQHFIKLLLTRGKNEDLKFEVIGILAAIQLGEGW